MQNAPLGAFCNTFDLHLAIIGLENQFAVFLRVAVLHRFYCVTSDLKGLFSIVFLFLYEIYDTFFYHKCKTIYQFSVNFMYISLENNIVVDHIIALHAS